MVEITAAHLLLLGVFASAGLDPDPFPYDGADRSGSINQPPTLEWTSSLPGSERVPLATNSEYSQPQMDARYIYMGASGADGLFRLERSDGTLNRSYKAAGPVKSAAVLLNDGVLFSDVAGTTWRYGNDERQPLWSHNAGAPILSHPVVDGERVLVSTVDGVIQALDLATGETLWRYAQPPDKTRKTELELYGSPPPVLTDGTILAGFHDGRLVALVAETGEVRWDKGVGEGRYPDIIGAPVVQDNIAYVGGFSAPFVAIDLATQDVLWRLDFGVGSTGTIAGPNIYVGGTDGKMRAIDRSTGVILWEWDSGSSGALTEPVLSDAGLLVGSSDGGLWLVEPDSGLATWFLDPDTLLQGISVEPSVAGRQVLVVTNASRLLSLVVPAQHPASRILAEAPWAAPFAPTW